MLNILMLNNEYPPLGGGQGNANYYIYSEFEKLKTYQIDIITSSVDKTRKEKTEIGNIYYLNIGKKGKNIHFQTPIGLLKYGYKSYKLAKKIHKNKKYDLIIAWSGVPAGHIAYKLHKKFSIPYIILLRGADVPFWESRWKFYDKLFFSKSSPIVWANAAKVIANSYGLKEQALKFTKSNQEIEVIYNGIDTKYFTPGKSKINGDKIIILAVGRLIPRKSYDLLIKACSNIKTKNWELWLVGDGPEKNNLEKLCINLNIKENVIFFGIKDKKELLELYQKAQIFCLPSLNEGMSNTVLEAMSCGLPIIATNVSGNTELIKENGLLINPNDLNALIDKLEILISNSDIRKKMGEKSREYAEKMSWDLIANLYSEIFNKV